MGAPVALPVPICTIGWGELCWQECRNSRNLDAIWRRPDAISELRFRITERDCGKYGVKQDIEMVLGEKRPYDSLVFRVSTVYDVGKCVKTAPERKQTDNMQVKCI